MCIYTVKNVILQNFPVILYTDFSRKMEFYRFLQNFDLKS